MGGRVRPLLLGLYLLLLLLSGLARRADDGQPAPGQAVAALPSGHRLAWWSLPAEPPTPAAPSILLLHGSPGRGADLRALGRALPSTWRRDAPDLPGFGGSTRWLDDYSARAQAADLRDWLDVEQLPRTHLVVHSMGGAAALELAALAPERVASITLIGAIGVVELELLGDPTLNHGLHGLQLLGLRGLALLVPHFGALDRVALSVPYARNFYDTDQRRLRPILERYAGPLLIVHGTHDVLVPVDAAREHHRIVPQSELVELDSDHFVVFRPEEVAVVADRVADFVRRVEAGTAPVRATAAPDRKAAAAIPFDPSALPPLEGGALVLTGALLGLSTFVLEDLAGLAGGLLAAQGRVPLGAAILACMLGIVVGDLLLVLLGRLAGQAALSRPPLSWWLRPETLERAAAWYRRHGAEVVLTSRFVPGMRLPTYVMAGVLRAPLRGIGPYFVLAAGVWTPLVVVLAAWAGEPALAWIATAQHGILWLLVFLGVGIMGLRTGAQLATWRGRRLARAWWLRQVRWEFWPMWRVYPPVLLVIAREMARHRSLTAFTAANPGMPAGGFVGESKWDIYQRLGGQTDASGTQPPWLPRTTCLQPEAAEAARAALRAFVAEVGWPVVLKPDAGQRGQGVAVVRDEAAALAYLDAARGPTLAQAYVPGREFGVFYVRHPDAPAGQVVSITDKRPVSVTGDGQHTLEQLILRSEEALPKAPLHLKVHADRLEQVPAPGEEIRLVEVGTHARGALFLDANRLCTPALEAAIDAISKRFEGGFFFGRYDIRVPSEEALARGEGLMVIEVNGVTSEPTHIYDPQHSVVYAWKTLAAQWQQVFAIGARNIENGVPPTSVAELVREIRRFNQETSRGHVATDRPLGP